MSGLACQVGAAYCLNAAVVSPSFRVQFRRPEAAQADSDRSQRKGGHAHFEGALLAPAHSFLNFNSASRLSAAAAERRALR